MSVSLGSDTGTEGFALWFFYKNVVMQTIAEVKLHLHTKPRTHKSGKIITVPPPD